MDNFEPNDYDYIRKQMVDYGRRLAIVESRLDSLDDKINELRIDLRELSVDLKALMHAINGTADGVHTAIEEVRETLNSHVLQEEKDRVKFLVAAFSATISAIVTIVGYSHLWAK